MSNYQIKPSIETWQEQYDPFITSILGYDENGRRISNKQLYIVYDVTYGDEKPDLKNNGKTLYSNKDGVIEVHFSERCHISIDLYIVSEFDESLDMNDMAPPEEYTCYHICNNLLLPFEAYILDFSAKYISDQAVSVNEKIPRKYVQCTLKKSNDTTARFTLEKPVYEDYLIDPIIVKHIDENIIKVSYYDSLLDKTWEDNITVIGKPQEVYMYAQYLGKEKQLNNLLPKEEVIVYMCTFDGYEESIVMVSRDDWEFASFPQITNVNMGYIAIAHNDLTCNVYVPFRWDLNGYILDAWYEGYEVKVGEKFVPDNFVIYLYDDKGLRTRLRFDYCQIKPDDYVVHKTGMNWYTILYRVGSYTLIDKVVIFGYEEPIYFKDDFKMYYLNKDLKTFTDVTKLFDKTCQIAEQRYFNWSKILTHITDLGMFGIYKLYAPVLTGLSTRCDTEWIIYSDSKKGLRAKLIKEYVDILEKENENAENNKEEE